MYKTSQFSDGKNRPGAYKVEFQGKWLRSCAELSFWFLWGDYPFDIREVRKHLGKKDVKKTLDLNWKLHDCTRFHRQMQELMDWVDERDFEKLLLEVAESVDQRNKKIVAENEAAWITDGLNF